MNPLISVIIPTYNRADFLLHAVKSVLAQSVRDFEIIVVDDGSTDNTRAALAAISNPQLHYHYQSNRGTPAALNAGLGIARGEWIARLDSDDEWLPDLLQVLVTHISRDPSLDVVYARAEGMDKHGSSLPISVGAPLKFANDPLTSLLYGDSVCPIAVMYRRERANRIGNYDESIPNVEDWDLWIRLAARGCRFLYEPRVLARYRFHPQNATANHSPNFEKLLRNRQRVLDKFYARIDIPDAAQQIRAQAYSNLYRDCAVRMWRARKYNQSVGYLERAARSMPQPVFALPRIFGSFFFHLALNGTRAGKWLVNKRAVRTV